MPRKLHLLPVVLVAAGLTACRQAPEPHAAVLLSERVQTVEREPAANGAPRYELRIPGDARYTYEDHAVALLMAFDARQCPQGGFQIGPERAAFPPGDARPAEGEPMALGVDCLLDRMPNHVMVEVGSQTNEALPDPANLPHKMGSAGPGSPGDRPVDTANRLIGAFVREAYTEDCGEQPMVVERIDTATEDGLRALTPADDGGQRQPLGPTVHAVLSFRCLGDDAEGDT